MPPSLRLLSRQKRFALLAITALGVAIAINTTMYSVLDALVRPQMRVPDAEHLYSVAYYGDYSPRIPQDVRNREIAALPIVMGVAASRMSMVSRVAEQGAQMRDVYVNEVSDNFFAVMQVQPSVGRLLSAADAGAATRVVVSDAVWRDLFPKRKWFDGATILIDGEPRIVAGTIDAATIFPGTRSDVWQLFSADVRPGIAGSIVRIRPNVGEKETLAMFALLARRWAARVGLRWDETAFRVQSFATHPFEYQRFHVALIGAIASLLLLACVNLANLQLARGVSRARELATRSAIGASRRDIVAQLVSESAWIAAGGLALGVVLTLWGVYLVRATVPQTLQEYIGRPYVSWRLFAFAAVAALACLGLVGLFPALRLSRVDLGEVLKSGAGTGTSTRTRRQYAALVTVQVALALPLLVAAALLMRTAVETLTIDTGRYKDLAVGWITVPGSPTDSLAARHGAQRLLRELEADSAITGAAYEGGGRPKDRMIAVDDPSGVPREIGTGVWNYSVVPPSFARVLQLRILKGRDFDDGEFAEPAAILDERTARYLFPGSNPIGRLIKLGTVSSHAPWVRVIGVSENFRDWFGLRTSFEVERFTSGMGRVLVLDAGVVGRLATVQDAWFQLYVRGKHGAEAGRLPLLVHRRLASMRPKVGLLRIAMFEDERGITRDRQRNGFIASLFGTFAVLALCVAIMGVYAVVAHSVSQREREFAVRKALGAADKDIRLHVLTYGRIPCLLGVAVGLVITARTVALLMAFLRSESDVNDSVLFGAVSLALFLATLAASYVPAQRAVRLEPATALRHD